jgi:hypothetical protein
MDKPAAHHAIVSELHKALETLGADPKLLATVNSWGDGMNDEQVLEALKMWNEEGGELDKRLAAHAEYIHAGNYYESAWRLFRLGHFKGLTDEEAARALGAWARTHGIVVAFDVRRFGKDEALFVILTDR